MVPGLQCDCAAKGNPFCIIFNPDLQKISDGDQFEVELEGLRGSETKLHFFHEFRSFCTNHLDFHLLTVAQDFRAAMENQPLWMDPVCSLLSEEDCASHSQQPQAPVVTEARSPGGKAKSEK